MTKRNLFEACRVASRRGGPVKRPLSRDAIVTEALRQITSGGLEGMSLRKVAAALETGPASLYAYVKDINELHALIFDKALATVDLQETANTSWRERLLGVLNSCAEVLSASPGLARLAFGSTAYGPNALRILEKLLALLEEGGIDPATSAWAVDLLGLFVTASVADHSGGAPDSAASKEFAAVSEHDYPHIYAGRMLLLMGTREERFGWALEVLLAGILDSPRPLQVKPMVAVSTKPQEESPDVR